MDAEEWPSELWSSGSGALAVLFDKVLKSYRLDPVIESNPSSVHQAPTEPDIIPQGLQDSAFPAHNRSAGVGCADWLHRFLISLGPAVSSPNRQQRCKGASLI